MHNLEEYEKVSDEEVGKKGIRHMRWELLKFEATSPKIKRAQFFHFFYS